MTATLSSSYQTLYTTTHGSGTPLLSVICQAAQTGGSGTKRTIKVRGGFKANGNTSATYFGYNCSWQPYIKANGTNYYGTTTTIKGSEFWYGTDSYRYFEQTINIDVGTTSSATITVYIATSSENSWGGSSHADCYVTATNSAPTWPSGTVFNITSPSYVQVGDNYYVPENTSSFTVKSNGLANDDGGQNNLVYSIYYSIGNGWVSIKDVSASSGIVNYTVDSSLTNYIKSNEAHVRFCVRAKDKGGLLSSIVSTVTVFFNQLTGASLSLSSGTITSSTTSFTANVSGASNQNENETFTYKLQCSGVTVYNNTLTAGSNTVYISESRTDGKPYIKKSALKTYLSGSNYSGTLSFSVVTTNAYGSSKTSSAVSKSVNLQGNPTSGAVSIGTTGDNASTCYKQYGTTSNYYYFPNGTDYVKVYWNAGAGSLGESVRYELYVAYGSGSSYGSWQLLKGFSSTDTRSYNHVISKQSSKRTVKYKVRTISTINSSLYSDKESSAIELQTYSGISLTISNITRTDTTATIYINFGIATSITSAKVVGSWTCSKAGSTTTLSNGTLGSGTGTQTISLKSLTADDTYNVKITYNDDSGFSSDTTSTVKIGGASPSFFVNKYGVGVGGEKADADYALKVNGNSSFEGRTYFEGNTSVNGDADFMGDATFERGVEFIDEVNVNGILKISSKTLLDYIYPVGSIVIRYDKLDPKTLFGGTWVRIENRFLWAIDDEGSVGGTGGESTHVLTEAEMPAHSGHLTNDSINSGGNGAGIFISKDKMNSYGTDGRGWNLQSGNEAIPAGHTKGSGDAHNNMPPYIQVSVWRRTA